MQVAHVARSSGGRASGGVGHTRYTIQGVPSCCIWLLSERARTLQLSNGGLSVSGVKGLVTPIEVMKCYK